MSKVSLGNVTSFQNDTTAVTQVNNNSSTITTAFDNTLSRDGTSPNQMQAVLDMNSNRIINLPAPAAATDAARLIDITTGGSGSTGTVTQLNAGAGISLSPNPTVTTGTISVSGVTDSMVSGVITGTHGGTGVNNSSNTITLGGNLTTSGAFNLTETLTGNTNVTFPTSGTLATTSQIQELLTADRVYYVRTTGNDSNTGLVDSDAGAFRTIQKAVNTVASLNVNAHQVIITLGDGVNAQTFTEAVILKNINGYGGLTNSTACIIRSHTSYPNTGTPTVTATGSGSISAGTLTWAGATGTLAIGNIINGTGIAAGTVVTSGSGTTWTVSPSQTVSSTKIVAVSASACVSATSGSCFSADGIQTGYYLSGINLYTNSSGNCINVNNGSLIWFGSIGFGNCAGHHVNASSHSTVQSQGDYLVLGAPASSSAHINCGAGAVVDIAGRKRDFSHLDLTFGQVLLCQFQGFLQAYGGSWPSTGTITASPWNASASGFIYAAGLSPPGTLGVQPFSGTTYAGFL